MIEVVNKQDEHIPVRVITTFPRERWEGHWKRGRKYPLYSVVENNGTKFMSLTGKAKDEPYVYYDEETDTFAANCGWVIKEMSADSRISALGGAGGGGGFASVTASVDGEGAEVVVSYDGPPGARTLDFAFSGLKGEQGEPLWLELYIDEDFYLHIRESNYNLSGRLDFDPETGYLTIN